METAEGIRWAEAIVCAMDLNPSSKGYFGYDRVGSVMKGQFLVNIASGEIILARDLKRLLDEKKLEGVALDVFENEASLGFQLRSGGLDVEKSSRVLVQLMEDPNVLFTPHNAFNSTNALSRKAEMTIRQLELLSNTEELDPCLIDHVAEPP